jgi:hypothetical protein
MNAAELEAKLDALETQVKAQKEKIRTLEDIEAIRTLQKAYAYYLEHWMSQEVIDCFSDRPDVILKLFEGTYLGKAGVRKYFDREDEPNPESLTQVMPIADIINVDPSGDTAKGRWYSWGAVATRLGGGIKQYFMNGIYENEYVKENGTWKIKKLEYNLSYSAPPAAGWVKPERIAAIGPDPKEYEPEPDIPPSDIDPRYPSGYIFPFHYKHPVTGKETSERKSNASLKGAK